MLRSIALRVRRVRSRLDTVRRRHDNHHDQQYDDHDDNHRAANDHYDDNKHDDHDDQQHNDDNHDDDCRRVLSHEWRSVLHSHSRLLRNFTDTRRLARGGYVL